MNTIEELVPHGTDVAGENPYGMRVIGLSPAIATNLLNRVPPYQRSLRTRIVARYARDMSKGDWALTHQPIAVDEDGLLADGRHRCAAVQLSGQTVDTYIAINVPRTVYAFIDAGTRRQINEVSDIRQHEASLMRAIVRLSPGTASRIMTVSELIEFWDEYRDSLDFISTHGRRYVGGYVRTTADINAALWRGYRAMDFGRFEHLSHILWGHELPETREPGDGSIYLLRDYVLAGVDARRGRPVEPAPSGKEPQRIRYAKTERAVFAYMERHDIDRLTPGDNSELFPEPELDQ